jgi:sigma-B regulation protein RsbU (phosphoserine phosphatase)
MPATATKAVTSDLIVDSPGATGVRVHLEKQRYRLGRSPSNELAFPADSKLSREHLVFEQGGEGWTVRDLGSLNGTLLNGARLNSVARLKHGDVLNAGDLCIRFSAPGAQAVGMTPEAVFDDRQAPSAARTISVDLKSALGRSTDVSDRSGLGNAHFQALVRAGRELAAHGSLDKLFELALDISLTTVKAARGIVMTNDSAGELQVRAVRGDGLRISSAVRDMVIRDARSLLVRDALLDQKLALQQSIVAQDIRSILAVPLQTDEIVIGLLYLDSPQLIREFTTEDLSLITVIANIAAIRIEHARLMEQEEKRKLFDQDLAHAAEIQRRLLPCAPPELSGFDLAGYNTPCRTVGGDYYDFLPYPDGRVAILIGDVSGKGLGAALLMSSLQARAQVIFGSSAQGDTAQLGKEVSRLNQSMAANCPGHCFVTFFIAILDPSSDELVYCNAGHNPPLLLRKNGELETLGASGIPLGITAHTAFEQKTCRLNRGDILVLFSDGITEACAAGKDEEFGQDRLVATVQNHQNCSAAALIQAVMSEVLSFSGGAPADDVTLVVAHRSLDRT